MGANPFCALAAQVLPRRSPPPPPIRANAGAGFLGSPLLDLQELARFENLLVFAQATVDGYFSGKHRSPDRGTAAEFVDYKAYVAGEDPGRLDWRVYGRTRRLHVRQFQEESDMAAYLLVDTSASMRYAGMGRPTKALAAARIAAALAYLMLAQGDRAALALFSAQLDQFVAPGGTRRHLHRIMSELERIQPTGLTGLGAALDACFPLFTKRGRLVILSDFLDAPAPLMDSLARFTHRKFEILLLQVLDPDELQLPLAGAGKYVDLENGEMVQVDPEEIRASYQGAMKQRIAALARESDRRGMEHRLVDTRRPYLDAIEAYLGSRRQNTRWR